MERYANEFISVFAEEYIEETKYRKNEVLENILNIIMCVVNTTPQKSVKEINIMSGNIINFISYSSWQKIKKLKHINIILKCQFYRFMKHSKFKNADIIAANGI